MFQLFSSFFSFESAYRFVYFFSFEYIELCTGSLWFSPTYERWLVFISTIYFFIFRLQYLYTYIVFKNFLFGILVFIEWNIFCLLFQHSSICCV